MNLNIIKRYVLGLSLTLLLLLIPVIGTGCAGQVVTGVVATTLGSTLVPDVNLDVYIYVNQGSPTTVPKNLIQAPQDIQVESMALWGTANGDTYSIAGALTITSASDASAIYSKLPPQNQVWTSLSDRTIYLVQGSGGQAEAMKNAISNNNFKHYNDSKALAEVSKMPYSDSAQPLAVGVVKPNQSAVNLVKRYLDSNTASTVDNINKWGKPQVIVLGLYSSQKLDISDISQKISNNTIWDANIGAMVLVSSSLPGFIVSPIANRVLENDGYTKVNVGSLSAYQSSLGYANGKSIPVLIDVDGNQVFITASGQQNFAQTLLTGIKQ